MVYLFTAVAGIMAALHLTGGFDLLDVKSYEEILSEPSSAWSIHECRSVLASNISSNNWNVESPVRVSATRFGPHTFAAINREDQIRLRWDGQRYLKSQSWDIERYLGLRIDTGSHAYRTLRGRRIRDERDLDSLLFLISFDYKVDVTNVGNPALAGVTDLKLFNLDAPDLTELKDNIFLENDKGFWLKPNWIAPTGTHRFGRQAVYASFQLRAASYDFLEESRSMSILIKGFGNDIRLPFTIQAIDVPR